MHRRTLLAAPLLAAPTLAAPKLASPALAQAEWVPERPIVVLLPYAPGGVTDTVSRAVCEAMARDLGRPVVMENRPGAGTAVANAAVARAAPDGHTLLMSTTSLAINPALQPTLEPRDPMAALLPIGMVFRTGFVLHCNKDLPGVTDLASFIAFAKARQGQLAYGSSGVGAVNHMAFELLKKQAGLDITHIPYRGGVPAQIDLIGGRIAAMFSATFESAAPVKEGRTRGLGFSLAARTAVLPELPAVAETLPGFDVPFWEAMFAPAGTPAHVIARLTRALQAAANDANLKARFAETGTDLGFEPPDAVRKQFDVDLVRWGAIIREQGITAQG
jgi:tripartite-type tricarboxylate transporter receptor subunit TctC